MDFDNKMFLLQDVDTGDKVRQFNFSIFENAYGMVCKVFADGHTVLLNFDLEVLEGNMPASWIPPAVERLKLLIGHSDTY